MKFKRVFDFLVAFFMLVTLLPVLLALYFLVRCNLGSPVLFVQERPGLKGRIFKIKKFRTMLDTKSDQGELLSDEQRLTRFGEFLRSTSLDELPGLLNVLAGDMSLVGPRPLLVEYITLYNTTQARRHEVRPGITGWAQVNGRNAISWEDKFAFDVWYVDNQSLKLDIKILLLTLKKVLVRSDISAEGHVTMKPFEGSLE